MTIRQSHRVGIQTKFLGPTNCRGSRVKAYTETKLSVTVSWDHALNPPDNHARAAKALVEKMEWGGEWVGGASGDGKGYVFVQVNS